MRTLLILLMLFHSSIHGQELIPNGGFEEILQEPCGYLYPIGENLSDYTAHWYSPSFGSADYFSRTATCYPVPGTQEGFSETHSGDRMAGIVTFSYTAAWGDEDCPGEGTEYLQVELLEELVPGQTYRLSAWFKLSFISQYACSPISFAFTESPVFHPGACLLDAQPTITIDEPILKEWTNIDTVFTAGVAAKFMTIGRLTPLNTINCVSFDGVYDRSYYFVDDVSLSMDLNTSLPREPNPDLQVTYEPLLTELYISGGKEFSGGDLQIYSTSGSLVRSSSVSIGQNSIRIGVHDLPTGCYIARLTNGLNLSTAVFIKH